MIALRPLALLAALASLYPSSAAHPVKAGRDYRSPDGKLIVTVIEVNKAHESRLEIRSSAGKTLLTNNYSSSDMEHGQVILNAAWTPDGEFFVFSMLNTGGHSPLARPTSFYGRQHSRLYSLDRAIGFITDNNFELQAPNWVITKRLDPTNRDESQQVRVALSTLVK